MSRPCPVAPPCAGRRWPCWRGRRGSRRRPPPSGAAARRAPTPPSTPSSAPAAKATPSPARWCRSAWSSSARTRRSSRARKAYGWAAGYRYDDSTIVGFSHTHFSGTGHSDLGDVLVMPIAGEVKLERGDAGKPGSGYISRFSHDDEVAEPGYYAVTLQDYGIRAELTASARVGVHRYTFPKGKPAHVLVDLRTSMYDYPGKVLWSRLRLRADGTVTGFRETRGWAPGRQLYFAMRFSRPVSGHQFHNTEQDVAYKGFPPPGEKDPRQRAQIEGRQLVGAFDFDDAAGQVAGGEGRDLAGQRGQRDRQSRRRSAGLGFRRRAPRRQGAVDAGARRGRHRCTRADAAQLLHRAVPHADGPEPVHGQRRPLSRSRQRGAPGEGLHPLLDVLAVGHLPRAASAADAGAAGAAQQRLRQFAARLATRTARTACCRCGRSTARRRGA